MEIVRAVHGFLNCVGSVDTIFCLLLQFLIIIVDGQNLSNSKCGKNPLIFGIKKPLKIKGSDLLKLMRKKQMFNPLKSIDNRSNLRAVPPCVGSHFGQRL